MKKRDVLFLGFDKKEQKKKKRNGTIAMKSLAFYGKIGYN
jgi:hypothetical protein